jgi:hypothetical protein
VAKSVIYGAKIGVQPATMLDYAEKGKDLTSIFFVYHKMSLSF